MKSVAVFALCLVAVLAVPSKRIINGSRAARGQFPYQALVTSATDSGKTICSGAIVSKDWVLTAGKCVVGATNATIAVGSNSLAGRDTSRVELTALRFVIHDGFEEKSSQNNIALIKLSRPLMWSTNVQAVRLAPVAWSADAVAVVSGWGTTSNRDTKASPDLRFASLKGISNRECAITYGTKSVTDEIICAVSSTDTVKGICAGDSGAPLVANASSNPVLVGIGNFYSPKGCEAAAPSGFTRISYFASWISSITV